MKDEDLQGLSFEDALLKLENIVRELESGRIKLDDAVTAYEQAVKLKQFCEQKLQAAQLKIEKIENRAGRRNQNGSAGCYGRTVMNDIKTVIAEYSEQFNRRLPDFFPLPDGPEKRVVEAMKYAVTNGGKRLRPYLVYETARLFGVDFSSSLRTAVALEMLHSYSLVHDDLPAMDNDDLRRGKPTCHKQFDEATAILAGDGLLTYAFEILSAPQTAADAETRCELISLLANGAGAFDGMIAGQMLDLYAEKLPASTDAEALIKHIEEMKTGRLIRYACEAGAILGKASPQQRQALIDYSRKIGIAFQIADDILDVEGEQELVGKTLNKDAAQGKVTFVTLYGLDNAKQISRQLIDEARQIIAIFGDKAENLSALAQYIIDRKY